MTSPLPSPAASAPAESGVATKKNPYAGPHTYRRVQLGDYAHVDRDFYERGRLELRSLKFSSVGAFENVTLTPFLPCKPTPLDVFLGEDGAIVATLLHIKFVGLTALVAAGHGIGRIVVLESWFSDGSIFRTSTANQLVLPPPLVKAVSLEPDTPIATLHSVHSRRVAEHLASDATVTLLPLSSWEDVERLWAHERLLEHATPQKERTKLAKAGGYAVRPPAPQLKRTTGLPRASELLERLELFRRRALTVHAQAIGAMIAIGVAANYLHEFLSQQGLAPLIALGAFVVLLPATAHMWGKNLDSSRAAFGLDCPACKGQLVAPIGGHHLDSYWDGRCGHCEAPILDSGWSAWSEHTPAGPPLAQFESGRESTQRARAWHTGISRVVMVILMYAIAFVTTRLSARGYPAALLAAFPLFAALGYATYRLRLTLTAQKARSLGIMCGQCRAPLADERAIVARHEGRCGCCGTQLFRAAR